MANPFVHVELNTTDVEKAKSFYSQMFDWKMEDMNMGPSDTYTGHKSRRRDRRRLVEEPNARRPIVLARVCASRRHPRRH
jgi:hypothetical protein